MCFWDRKMKAEARCGIQEGAQTIQRKIGAFHYRKLKDAISTKSPHWENIDYSCNICMLRKYRFL